MRKFFNLYLSMILPITVLFILLSTGKFMMDYELSKAIKLGVLSGFIISVIFSAIMTSILLLMRKARTAHIVKNHPEQTVIHKTTEGSINKTFILLMDKAIAFDVTIQAIIDQHIGEVAKDSRKKKGNITVYTDNKPINLLLSPLTKHTTQISVSSDSYNDDVIAIINYLKMKEHTFLNY